MMELLITTLAVYGVSALVSEYDGYKNMFSRLRQQEWASMTRCLVCLSVWVSGPLVILYLLGLSTMLIPLAIVGFIILLERIL